MADLPKDIFVATRPHTEASHAILMITADGTEDVEFFYPYYRFIEEGFRVDVATPKGTFKGKNGTGLKETLKLADVDASKYELLYIPGGKAPAELKDDPLAIELTQKFAKTGKPIAAICHGPQLLAAADLIHNHKIAAYPEVEDEILASGGAYVDQETLVDGQFITARWPGDLPSHLRVTLARLHTSLKDSRKAA